VLWVGLLVAAPMIFLMVTYAYEDIFGSAALMAKPPAMAPGGTAIITPVKPAAAGAGKWSLATKIGLAGAALVVLIILLAQLVHHMGNRFKRYDMPIAEAAVPAADASPVQYAQSDSPYRPGTPPEAVEAAALDVFGPVTEQALTNLTA